LEFALSPEYLKAVDIILIQEMSVEDTGQEWGKNCPG
jgi:hypothetical protein